MEKTKKIKRFRTKILLILIFSSIVPLVIAAIINYILIVEKTIQNITEQENLALTTAEEKINKYLDQKRSALNLVVDRDTESVRYIQKADLDFIIKNLKESVGDVIRIAFVDLSGRAIIRMPENDQYNYFDMRDDSLMSFVLFEKRYISTVKFKDKIPYVTITAQIENNLRQPIGIVAADISLQPLTEQLDNIRLGNSAYIYLADNKGNIISGTVPKQMDSAFLQNSGIHKNAINGMVFNGTNGLTITANATNDSVVLSSRPMGYANWSILCEWPETDAFSIINLLFEKSILVMIFTVFTVLIISLLLSRQIVKPIERLNIAAQEITNGNLEYSVDIRSNNEFALLADKFNEMVHVLKDNQKLKDEFVHLAAHELRSPVTAIRGYVSMLIDDGFGTMDEEARKIVKTVGVVNGRLIQLVDDLLAVARAEKGNTSLEIKTVNIGQVIKDTISELIPIAAKKGLKIVYYESSEELFVLADLGKLKEVIVNLTNNAIKYSDKNKDIMISHIVKDGAVITSIKDGGMGISRENMEKLFNKFFRVKNTATMNIEGTGLGLYICKQIIETMNGHIWVESQESIGSTFSFSLKKA
jgi:signal transduction histidine kinase